VVLEDRVGVQATGMQSALFTTSLMLDRRREVYFVWETNRMVTLSILVLGLKCVFSRSAGSYRIGRALHIKSSEKQTPALMLACFVCMELRPRVLSSIACNISRVPAARLPSTWLTLWRFGNSFGRRMSR